MGLLFYLFFIFCRIGRSCGVKVEVHSLIKAFRVPIAFHKVHCFGWEGHGEGVGEGWRGDRVDGTLRNTPLS